MLREIVFFTQQHLEATAGSIPRHTRSVDTAAYDQQINVSGYSGQRWRFVLIHGSTFPYGSIQDDSLAVVQTQRNTAKA
ncbi:MAG: hypothetical protein Kow006_20250 [Gammaproteobacteria bacterium]